LAAYNAGTGRVNQWRKQISQRDWDEFVENIPFRETQWYIKNVLRNYHIYQKIYGQEKAEKMTRK
ncbi:MAG: hypothetical protein D6736_17335, partial [Nitrospinota bacterium]